jgi:hypothetical protein
MAFAALLITAAWYGVRRRGKSGDAFAFFALMLLAMIDARNLPYFGLIAAPLAADAAASYYVGMRSAPGGSLIGYSAAFAACAFTFIATIVSTEPKVIWWPQPVTEPAKLMVALAADHRPHEVLCEQPRWCDGMRAVFPTIHPLLDDRAGLADAATLHAQEDAVDTKGWWRVELAREHVDAVVANHDANIVALLSQTGWHVERTEGGRVLLVPEGAQ